MRPERGKASRLGFSAIWAVFFLLLMVAFVGLAIDTGYGLLVAHQLQNAADAAALGGAQYVKVGETEARTAAVQVGAANSAAKDPVQLALNETNDLDGDIVLGRYERDGGTFRATLDVPNAVKVTGRRTSTAGGGPVPMLFGPIFGYDNMQIARTAIAMNQGGSGAGLIVLCPYCECALQFGGNNAMTITTTPEYGGAAAIQVNSDHSYGVCGNGASLVIEADELNMVGKNPGYDFNANATVNCDINPDSPPIPDPLAELPAPTWNESIDLGAIDATRVYDPGYYSQGVRLTSSGTTATLNPGIYVVDGQGGPDRGLYVNGGNLIAPHVMFYVIGEGVVYLGGNGIIDIGPSENESDPYWGITIFQARDNTNPITIIGTSNMNLGGTYYFPVGPVEIGGEGISLGNMMIAWTFWIHGRGTFTVAYDGRFPSNAYHVYLVE